MTTTKPLPTTRVPRTKSSFHVLGHMMKSPPKERHCAILIAEALNMTTDQASARLAYLHNSGHITRVAYGWYVLGRHALAATAQPASAPSKPTPLASDHDTLLELVLPAGYVFKPSHLAAMQLWKEQTAALLATLTA